MASTKSSHPSYFVMASDAIKELKEKKGSSRSAIFKFIISKYKLDASTRVRGLLNKSLHNAVDKGFLVNKSGTSGRFIIKDQKIAKKSATVVKKPKKIVPKKNKRTSSDKMHKKSVTKKSAPKKSTPIPKKAKSATKTKVPMAKKTKSPINKTKKLQIVNKKAPKSATVKKN